MSTITIELRQAGTVRAAMPCFELALPPHWTDGKRAITVRDLLSFLVRQEVEAFQRRQTAQRILPYMTTAQVEKGAAQGKIDPRPELPVATVAVDRAIANAVQSFTDGLFFLFVDDQQQDDIDAPLMLLPNSRITLLRLIALAGG